MTTPANDLVCESLKDRIRTLLAAATRCDNAYSPNGEMGKAARYLGSAYREAADVLEAKLREWEAGNAATSNGRGLLASREGVTEMADNIEECIEAAEAWGREFESPSHEAVLKKALAAKEEYATLRRDAEAWRAAGRAPAILGDWVIEFRSGSFFQNLEAENGGPVETAMRFASEDACDDFMAGVDWMNGVNGEMPLCRPATNAEQHARSTAAERARCRAVVEDVHAEGLAQLEGFKDAHCEIRLRAEFELQGIQRALAALDGCTLFEVRDALARREAGLVDDGAPAAPAATGQGDSND